MRVNRIGFLFCLLLSGCNFWGWLDNPTNPQQDYSAGLADADNEDCKGARDHFLSNKNPTDDEKEALGWAYMCIAGGSAKNIASTITKYKSNSPDLSVIGQLAGKMAPINSSQLAAAASAIEVLVTIQEKARRDFHLSLGYLVQAASVLADQDRVSSSGGLKKTSIADQACEFIGDCTSGCPTNTSGGMSEDSIGEYTTYINRSLVSMRETSATELIHLLNALEINLPTNRPQARCNIYKLMMP